MSCTGPYTRVVFDAANAKAARKVIETLHGVADSLDVRHLPQGQDGLNDFALDVDFAAPNGDGKWEVRCAKYLGPKKFIGHSYIYDAAIRNRTVDGQIRWEGYVFADSLNVLSSELARVLPTLVIGQGAQGVFSRDDAEIHRVELCTGELL